MHNRIAELEQQLAACNAELTTLKQNILSQQDHYRLLFNHSRDALLFLDRDSGKLLDVNDSAVKMYGYSREELLTMSIFDLRAENTRPVTQEQMAQADLQGLLFETAHCKKDGTEFQVEVSSQGVTLNNRRSLISIVRDITERKQAEEERLDLLRQIQEEKKEAEYRIQELNAIIESINDPVIVYDQDGYIFKSNESAARAHGKDLKNAYRDITFRTMQIRHPDGSPVEQADLPSSKTLRGSTVIREYFEIVNQNGREMYIQVTATPLYVNGVQRGAVSVWHDITELKHSEDALQVALKKAEEGSLMLEAILANLPAGMAITSGPPDYIISRVSRFGADLLESTEEIMTGIPAGTHRLYWRWLLPDGKTRPTDEQMPMYRAAHFGETVYNAEFIMEVSKGKKIPISVTAAPVRNARGEIVAAISTWSDIAHIKQAEEILNQRNEALRLSEDMFRSMFQSAPFAISLSEMEGGPYVQVNDAWCDLMEYPRDEVIGKTPAELYLDQSVDNEQYRMAAGSDEREFSRQFEVKTLSKSGRPLVLSCNVEVVNVAGKLYHLNTIENITDRRQAEIALNRYAAELERSNHELQEFAFVASHDLQEPLRKIETFTDLILEESVSLSGRQKDMFSRLKNAASRMRGMITGLLQLSRVSTDAQPFSRVDLNHIITEVLTDLDQAIESSGGKVETAPLPVIEADPYQIQQLFLNLIANAIKFQPAQNKPLVQVYAEKPDSETVKITVQDNGIGFDHAHIDTLFQPFKRLVSRQDYEGNGMGLAICRKIVERH
ncbi:MAG: PAS domain S-box protein, partial [Anaerolineaceae bacterium]